MSRSPMNAVESIFSAALEKPNPEERAAYLQEACGTDAELRREVERLLSAEPKVGAFLNFPASALVATVDETIIEGPGTVIGPYKLMEQIGEGGMGLVFVAEQQERKGVRLGFPKIRDVFQALSLSRILLKENLT